jgi:uncharacterized membrane protein
MTTDKQMENYLATLRMHLAPLTLSEREEIVKEIAAHVRDSAEQSGATVESVLARLEPPEALAKEYRDGLLISRASRSFSPLLLLRATLRVTSKGIAGIAVFFMGLFGYAVGVGLVITALLKPIFPANTGLWVLDGHVVSSGTLFPPPAPPAHEVLGMGYILIALVAGSLTLLTTTWSIRNFLRLSRGLEAQIKRLG